MTPARVTEGEVKVSAEYHVVPVLYQDVNRGGGGARRKRRAFDVGEGCGDGSGRARSDSGSRNRSRSGRGVKAMMQRDDAQGRAPVGVRFFPFSFRLRISVRSVVAVR